MSPYPTPFFQISTCRHINILVHFMCGMKNNTRYVNEVEKRRGSLRSEMRNKKCMVCHARFQPSDVVIK